jgi:hypothetical protein
MRKMKEIMEELANENQRLKREQNGSQQGFIGSDDALQDENAQLKHTNKRLQRQISDLKIELMKVEPEKAASHARRASGSENIPLDDITDTGFRDSNPSINSNSSICTSHVLVHSNAGKFRNLISNAYRKSEHTRSGKLEHAAAGVKASYSQSPNFELSITDRINLNGTDNASRHGVSMVKPSSSGPFYVGENSPNREVSQQRQRSLGQFNRGVHTSIPEQGEIEQGEMSFQVKPNVLEIEETGPDYFTSLHREYDGLAGITL